MTSQNLCVCVPDIQLNVQHPDPGCNPQHPDSSNDMEVKQRNALHFQVKRKAVPHTGRLALKSSNATSENRSTHSHPLAPLLQCLDHPSYSKSNSRLYTSCTPHHKFSNQHVLKPPMGRNSTLCCLFSTASFARPTQKPCCLWHRNLGTSNLFRQISSSPLVVSASESTNSFSLLSLK